MQFFVSLVLLVFFTGNYSVIAQKNKSALPNIIYIYADDMGYGELGCYGQQKIKTPNIDKLAEEGIIFTQHYTSSPVCAPARCMLLTGMHGGHSYIRGNYELGEFSDEKEGGQMPLPPGVFTLPMMLKKAGYSTALCGKWGLGMPAAGGSPLMHGFDYYYGFLDQKQAHNYYPTHLWENDKWDTLDNHAMNVHQRKDSSTFTDKDFEFYKGKEYAPNLITEKAVSFIERNKHGPFFLYLPYTLPHVSLQAPEEYVKKYIGLFDEKPYYGQKGYAANKFPFSTYAAMITYLDDQVGLIMKRIKELGIDNNTFIMFSSDNGASAAGGANPDFFNSVRGLRGLKMDLFEGGIRMPFIARWPGKIRAGSQTQHISAQYDVMATFAELTKQQLTTTDGISFLPELFGKATIQKKHPYLYFEYPENGGQVAIRMGKWKAIKRNLKKNPDSPWMIFDLDKDEKELVNIATLHPELVRQFDTILKKEHQCPHIKEWEIIDPRFDK